MADTAAEQLERILYVLAAAALPGGATDAELSAALGVSLGQAARDVTSLADRVYYHPPGGTAGADILVEEGRVQVIPRGGPHRPARLSGAEAAALAFGLRTMALEASGERRRRLSDLGQRLERFAARAGPALSVAGDADAAGPAAVHEQVRRAAIDRRACAIEYLKPDGTRSQRTIQPYALVHAERWWYVLGADAADGHVRFFRLDRVLAAALRDETFRVPADFDAHAHLSGPRAFAAHGAERARVRYAARIAPWVRERWPAAEMLEDGSVEVEHAVADRDWIVGHVLQYGSDAELLSPHGLRDLVRRRAEALVRAWSAPPHEPA